MEAMPYALTIRLLRFLRCGHGLSSGRHLATRSNQNGDSEYIKRQVFATFIADPVFVDSLHRYGPENIMWSSDYPHTAATFPRSREIVQKRLGHLPEEQRRQIVHDTAARIYGLE